MRRIATLLFLGCLCNDPASARFFHRRRLNDLRPQQQDDTHRFYGPPGRPFRRNRKDWFGSSSTSRVGPLHGGHQDTIDVPTSSSTEETTTESTTTQEQAPPPPQQQQDGKQQRIKRLFGTFSKHKTYPYEQNLKLIRKRLDAKLAQIKNSAKTMFDENSDGVNPKERLLSALGPSLMAVWGNRGAESGQILSFATLYALSLLGASVGFYCFLYFITVGYALGITIPMTAALTVYVQRLRTMDLVVPPEWNGVSTLLHSGLVVVWGIRAWVFFVWREYFNWPDLHKQIKHVNENNAPTLPVKCLIWVIYSFLYTSMLSPCWLRLQQSSRIMVPKATTIFLPVKTTTTLHPLKWICIYLPIGLQMVGLLLETIADYQKSAFKRHNNRYEWCHVGLWKWSTHPNYLGEMIFWTGTYLGWILFSAAVGLFSTSAKTLATLPSTASWLGQLALASVGYFFITTVLRGSIRSMGDKHWQKYGHIPEYAAFRQSHGLLGPKWKNRHLQSSNQTVVETEQESTQ